MIVKKKEVGWTVLSGPQGKLRSSFSFNYCITGAAGSLELPWICKVFFHILPCWIKNLMSWTLVLHAMLVHVTDVSLIHLLCQLIKSLSFGLHFIGVLSFFISICCFLLGIVVNTFYLWVTPLVINSLFKTQVCLHIVKFFGVVNRRVAS